MDNSRRNAYEAGFKLKAINVAVEEGNRAASRKFGINESMVRRWRQQHEELSRCKETTKAFRGHRSKWPKLQNVLDDWVHTQGADGRGVSAVHIRLKAEAIDTDMTIEDLRGEPSLERDSPDFVPSIFPHQRSTRDGTTTISRFAQKKRHEDRRAPNDRPTVMPDLESSADNSDGGGQANTNMSPQNTVKTQRGIKEESTDMMLSADSPTKPFTVLDGYKFENPGLDETTPDPDTAQLHAMELQTWDPEGIKASGSPHFSDNSDGGGQAITNTSPQNTMNTQGGIKEESTEVMLSADSPTVPHTGLDGYKFENPGLDGTTPDPDTAQLHAMERQTWDPEGIKVSGSPHFSGVDLDSMDLDQLKRE